MPGQPRPLLIAHRGESRDAPENTLAAIALAWARGADAVEIDVRTSADGQPVVIHDPDTRRLGGPRRVVGRETAAALRRIDAGRWRHPRWSGERIPLLAEVLRTVPSSGRLFVELKEGPAGVPPVVVALRQADLRPAQLLVMSFKPATVSAAVAALPGVDAFLLRTARQWTGRGQLDRVIRRASALGCRGLNLEVDRALGAATVAAARAAGLRLCCYTVNRPATARRLAAAGIDGITTDRCAWLREQLDAGRKKDRHAVR